VDALLEFLNEISRELARAEVPGIRNRIEHQRADFPSRDEVADMCSRLEKLVTAMESHGVCPPLFIRKKRVADSFGRTEEVYVDYAGREVTIPTPSVFRNSMPTESPQLIVVPSLCLVASAEPVRFVLEENSAYVERWANYPRRRPRDGSVQAAEVADPTEEVSVSSPNGAAPERING
jgi:hypothetical protein